MPKARSIRGSSSPHFTGSAAVDWRPIPKLNLSAEVRRHSSYFSDNADKPLLEIAGAAIADVRAEFQLQRFSIFIQAHNLFDTFAMKSLFVPTSGEAEEPRRISAGVEARF